MKPLQAKTFLFHEDVGGPDYAVTKQYGLRWDAAKETAYPSTFLLDTKGVIYFASIAKMHGGRTSATEILELLPKKK